MPQERAGYSGTPLPRKLGIREGDRVLLVRAPAGLVLDPLPPGASVSHRTGGAPADVVVLFCADTATLHRRFGAFAAALPDHGGLWVAWPKKSSGVVTDLTEAQVRAHGLAGGLVDVKVCAIDEVWSGLRFVRRVADRLRARPTGG